MTVKELRESLAGYPPDMDVQLAVNRLLHPAKQVYVCIDMDSNVKHCVIYADVRTLDDVVAEARAHLNKLRNKVEVAAS